MGQSSRKKIRTSTQNGSDFRPFLRHSLTRTKKYFVRNTKMFFKMSKKDWENILDNKYLGQLCCSNNWRIWLTDSNTEPPPPGPCSWSNTQETGPGPGSLCQGRRGWGPSPCWCPRPSWLQWQGGPQPISHPFPPVHSPCPCLAN